MASDNRDWYRDWWRKKTGYVERAGFRMSEADRLKAKRVVQRRLVFIRFGTLAAIVVALIGAKRLLY